jgi:hypothetical protein
VIVYREPGLHALELWHGLAGGIPLYRLRESKQDYFSGLCRFLTELHRGVAGTEDPGGTCGLRKAAGFERAIFCGGAAHDPMLERALSGGSLPFEVTIDPAGEFCAGRGAQRIFEQMGWRHGVALDLGQTQLKVFSGSGCFAVARDLEMLPAEPGVLEPQTGRSRLRDMIRGALCRIEAPADGVVLGLPVALDDAGIADPSTYPGLCGPVEAIFADLFTVPWVVLNDAMLTAAGFPPSGRRKTAVLTLGFGIGGALWDL